MTEYFLRIFFLIIIVFFQVSFVDIIAPTLSAPILLITAIVAWTLIVGFPRSLGMTVALTVLYDFVTAGNVTIFSLFGVALAYATSFVSRRLLIERRGFGIFISSMFSLFGVLAYSLLGFWYFLLPQGSGLMLAHLLPSGASSGQSIFFTLLGSGALFLIIYPLIHSFEERLQFTSQKQFSGIK